MYENKKIEYKNIPISDRSYRGAHLDKRSSSKNDTYQRHYEAKNKDIQDLVEKQRKSEKNDLEKLDQSPLAKKTGLTSKAILATLHALARKKIDVKYNPDVQGEYDLIVRDLEKRHPLGNVWSTQDLKELPVDQSKSLPVEPNAKSAPKPDGKKGTEVGPLQQDTSNTDIEVRDQLMHDLRVLSRGTTPNLRELPSIAKTLLKYYNTKFTSTESYFEKQGAFWEEQRSNAIKKMDSLAIQMKNSEDYQKLVNTLQALEALDENKK